MPSDRTLLDAEAVAGLAAGLPAWTCDGSRLSREFVFADFNGAFAFMTRVAVVAEELGHHPDWSNSWNTVAMTVTTHSAGGLTGLDVAFVGAVDDLLR